MHLLLPLLLACDEHSMPNEPPDSWRCRLEVFRQSSLGHSLSLGLQFVAWFMALLILRWAILRIVRWRKSSVV